MLKNIKTTIETYFLSAVLLIAFVLVFLVLRPYLPLLLLAVVLVVLFRPVFNWINTKMGNHRVVSSILTTLLILVIIIVPLSIFATLVISEVNGYFNSSHQALVQNFHLPAFIEKYNFNFQDYFHNIISGLLNDIGSIFTNLAKLFIDLTLTVVSMVYLFKDGDKIEKAILEAMPLEPEQKNKLRTDMAAGIRAIIGGYFLIALLQGVMTGIGFTIFRVPNPALWGFVTMIFALLPTAGAAFINIPAIAYLFWVGQPGLAIGLAIWYLAGLTLIDNFIGPRFISGRVKIHILLIIFSTIGGVGMFGAIGIITGPLIMIFFWSILEIFQDKENELVKS